MAFFKREEIIFYVKNLKHTRILCTEELLSLTESFILITFISNSYRYHDEILLNKSLFS